MGKNIYSQLYLADELNDVIEGWEKTGWPGLTVQATNYLDIGSDETRTLILKDFIYVNKEQLNQLYIVMKSSK